MLQCIECYRSVANCSDVSKVVTCSLTSDSKAISMHDTFPVIVEQLTTDHLTNLAGCQLPPATQRSKATAAHNDLPLRRLEYRKFKLLKIH